MRFAIRRPRLLLAAVLLGLGPAGCLHPYPADRSYPRAFDPATDALAYANQLVWSYGLPAPGRATASVAAPPPDPDYAHHCFAMVRVARAFFRFARFEPDRPRPDADTLKRRVREVVEAPPDRAEEPKIEIPGYANLRQLSADREPLLKEATGGAWRSYVQRGNWRMALPFLRREQARTASQLEASLARDRPPIVHVVRLWPPAINHAVLLYGVEDKPDALRFHVYDPNAPDVSRWLVYDRKERTFHFPPTAYFPGGRVDVYEVFRGWVH